MDFDSEKTKLLQRDAQWAALASEGRDVEAILSYWTDDAVVLPPGFHAVIGKAALREYVQGSLQIPGFNITWFDRCCLLTGRKPRLHLKRKLGYDERRRRQARNYAGRAVTTWRREPDGEWRRAVDIWNGPPAA